MKITIEKVKNFCNWSWDDTTPGVFKCSKRYNKKINIQVINV